MTEPYRNHDRPHAWRGDGRCTYQFCDARRPEEEEPCESE